MTLANKLNWRLILIHSAATFLIMLSIREFILLSNIDINFALRIYGIEKNHDPSAALQWSDQLRKINSELMLGPLFGLLAAFIISSITLILRKGFWINSWVVLTLSLFLIGLGLVENRSAVAILFYFGILFAKQGFIYGILINLVLLLIVSLYLLLSKRLYKLSIGLHSYKPDPKTLDDDF